MTVPKGIAHSVQQTQQWLKELMENAGLASESEAFAVLRAVLHQLRDRLTVQEAVDLGAQLPLVIRGVYYEGWRPSHVPERIHTRQEFFDAVTVKLLPHRLAADPMVRAVLALVAHHCDPGEISDVIAQLPDELKGLWPESARTWRARMKGVT